MQYLLKIQGLTPYLPEKYVHKVVDAPTKHNKDYSEEWKEKTYIDKDGEVVIPANVFKACLINGSKGLHEGKTYMSKLVPAGIVLGQMESKVTYEGKTITLDTIEKNGWIDLFRKVVNGASNTGNRTEIPNGWTTNWTLIVRDEQLTESRIKAVVENAGIYAGLGGQRPSSPKKPGSNGQFKISSLKKIKN